MTYWHQVKQYLEWCRSSSIDPRAATRETIKIYRWWLSEQRGYKPKTIAIKLTAVSRLYDAAMEYGLMGSNPAWGIKPPTQSIDPAARITYLEQGEATTLLQSISNNLPLKTLRDKLLLGVMTLEGTRTVEMHRLNVGDVVRQGQRVGLKVSSKRHTRVVPLTPQLGQILEEYLSVRRERDLTVWWIVHYRSISVIVDGGSGYRDGGFGRWWINIFRRRISNIWRGGRYRRIVCGIRRGHWHCGMGLR